MDILMRPPRPELPTFAEERAEMRGIGSVPGPPPHLELATAVALLGRALVLREYISELLPYQVDDLDRQLQYVPPLRQTRGALTALQLVHIGLKATIRQFITDQRDPTGNKRNFVSQTDRRSLARADELVDNLELYLSRAGLDPPFYVESGVNMVLGDLLPSNQFINWVGTTPELKQVALAAAIKLALSRDSKLDELLKGNFFAAASVVIAKTLMLVQDLA